MKRNGFTLIELLAVIVILAIIALIATPIVLNIINNAKTSSNERSGELYIKSVENAIMKKQLNGTDVVTSGTYTVQVDGSICIVSNNVCSDGTTIEVSVKGDIPAVGSTITVDTKGIVTEYNMTVSGTEVKKVTSSSDDEEVAGSATFTDGVTLTWDQLCDGYEEEKYGYNHEYILEDKIKDSNIEGATPEGAFVMCSQLKSIILPSTVTEIGNYSFAYSSLVSITIPSSVSSIGSGSFEGCSGLINVTIPNSVTSIGSGAFQRCTNLTNVIIGNGLTNIEEDVFFNCKSLLNIIIPSSITSIGSGAFENCTNLTSVAIPSSVTSIGSGAFYSCRSLTEVKVGSEAVKTLVENSNTGYNGTITVDTSVN